MESFEEFFGSSYIKKKRRKNLERLSMKFIKEFFQKSAYKKKKKGKPGMSIFEVFQGII